MIDSIIGLKTDINSCNIFEQYECETFNMDPQIFKLYIQNNIYKSFTPETDDISFGTFQTFDDAFNCSMSIQDKDTNMIAIDYNNNTYNVYKNPKSIKKTSSEYDTYIIPNIDTMCNQQKYNPSDFCSYFNKIYSIITGASNYSGGHCNNGVIGTYSLSDQRCNDDRPYGGSSNVYYNFDNVPSQDDIDDLMNKVTISMSNIIENILNIKVINETNIGVNSRSTINISKSFVKGNVINNNSINAKNK